MNFQSDLTQRIRLLFENAGIAFQQVAHEPATTCEQAAAARGLPVSSGIKSLLFYDKKKFSIFTLSARLAADNKKIRKILGSSWLRFAREEELLEQTGVVKGALPPFGGGVLFPFDHYLDESILKTEQIAFNAGVLDLSFILKVSDYLKIVQAHTCQFSK